MRFISILAVTGIITTLLNLNPSVEAATLISIKQPLAKPVSVKSVKKIFSPNNHNFGRGELFKQGRLKPTKIKFLEPINIENTFSKSDNTIEYRNFKQTNDLSNSLNSTIVSAKQVSNLPIPRLIAGTVLQNLSQLTLSPISSFSIVKVESKTWSNSCLDLVPPGTMCTQSMITGWRVVAKGKRQKWVYHTSDKGTVVLNGLASLPPSLANAVLQRTSQETQIPISKLSIMWVEPKIWSDGCLNLATPGITCTQSMIPGWQITVNSGTERWVYHTDLSSKIRLDVAASR